MSYQTETSEATRNEVLYLTLQFLLNCYWNSGNFYSKKQVTRNYALFTDCSEETTNYPSINEQGKFFAMIICWLLAINGVKEALYQNHSISTRV